MSELLVNTIKKADGTGSLTVPAESGTVVTTASPSLGRRNLIINGAMQVAQRGTSAVAAGNTYLIDRFKNWKSGAGAFTVEQSTDVPTTDPFYYSLKATVTTSSTPSGNDYYGVAQYIEGNNVQGLGFGTSSAKTITLSFWVKSSVTGTYTVGISNQDGATRTYAADYSISSANTWEKKILTISGDTTGTWGKTNGTGMRVWFALGMGSTYSTSTSNAWEASAGIQSPSAIDWIANSGATFYLTGVQLEVGSVATPFEHRSYGEELALCQRYAVVMGGDSAYERFGYGVAYNTDRASIVFPIQTEMRTPPSFSYSGTIALYNSIGLDNVNGVEANQNSTKTPCNGYTTSGSITQGGFYLLIASNDTSARVTLDAEL